MVMPLKGYDKGQHVLHGAELIDGATLYPMIRLFDVPKKIAATPLENYGGDWKIYNRDNAPAFSAIAFQFAVQLQKQLRMPIGLITCYWGSTAKQSWMSEAGLRTFPEVIITTRSDTMKVPAVNFKVAGKDGIYYAAKAVK